ncbi:hypothetical protein KKE06_03470, partial [Candidatus Micrarchaeota archaeon]|nr:hypothetical protein [Candidatus Micrarchaeota archaeon]MBU1930277.1 hypothetical protein [Candidatus Micrarchaeota archaeon]
MNLHKKTFLFGFFSILLLGSVSALQIGGSRGGSCENAFCNLADDIVYWGNLQNIPATLAYLNQQNTFTAAQTFQTKVNAFDLNVGHDLNVGNDLNVVRDANATRFCLPDGNCWSSGEIITNTLGNSKYWRLDGTSAPPTANWNMGDYNFT